jgi:CDGSH-type Zn-finger protein
MTRRPMPLDGPRIVRGVDFVVDPDGEATKAERPAVAVCRCDASARKPWCDGTHKLLARRAAAS